MIKIATTAAIVLGLAAITGAPAAIAQASPPPNNDDSKILCKYVVAATPGSKPYRMCKSKSDWALKETQDAQDANRIVCHYEDVPGSRLKGRKVCQPASRWADDKLLYREKVEKLQMETRAPF